MRPIAAPCPIAIMIIPSIDRSVPNAATAITIESGPKNTRQKVAIDSANQALPFTIKGLPFCFQYKTFWSILRQTGSKIINYG
jgi:hypothetical protein